MGTTLNIGADGLPRFKTWNGWVVFESTPETPALSGETLDEWETAEHEAEHRRAFDAGL